MAAGEFLNSVIRDTISRRSLFPKRGLIVLPDSLFDFSQIIDRVRFISETSTWRECKRTLWRP
jgi:hypothetical protein